MRNLPIHCLLQLRKRPHHVILLQRDECEAIGARRRIRDHFTDVLERLFRVGGAAGREVDLTQREKDLLVVSAGTRASSACCTASSVLPSSRSTRAKLACEVPSEGFSSSSRENWSRASAHFRSRVAVIASPR